MFTQITLGRATKDKPIDVDLSLEGPAWKISRKQGELTWTLESKTIFQNNEKQGNISTIKDFRAYELF